MLAGPDGRPATSAADWADRVRPHQLRLLESHIYGRRLPPVFVRVAGEPVRSGHAVDGGQKAIRIEARLVLGDGPRAPAVNVLLWLPKSEQPVPVFLYLNFVGNAAEDAAPAMLARGYGVATACYHDIFPDKPEGRGASGLAAVGRPVDGDIPPDEPGAIATWAWGLSRILDWLVRLPEVDATRVIVVGHSRNGKAALWAGACDERFAMVVSNESGCGGAALERRNYGETTAEITRRFPHWFCPRYATYAGRAAEMPTDQHALLAMAAPRPLYVASAIEDRWADPRGEFLACVAAEPVCSASRAWARPTGRRSTRRSTQAASATTCGRASTN
ncbi:acetylxylan esterase [bacterium]|nr:acetylxylan esterase [bacterium]